MSCHFSNAKMCKNPIIILNFDNCKAMSEFILCIISKKKHSQSLEICVILPSFVQARTHLVYTRITCNIACSESQCSFVLLLLSLLLPIAINWAATDEQPSGGKRDKGGPTYTGGERTRVSADTLVKMAEDSFAASVKNRQINRHGAFTRDPYILRLFSLVWGTLRRSFKSW